MTAATRARFHSAYRHAGKLLAAAAITLAATPAAHAEDACSPYGINTYAYTLDDLDALDAAGFDWVRIEFKWFELEPHNDAWNFAHMDSVIAHADALGLNVFATLAYTPQWASTNPSCMIGGGGETGCSSQRFTDVAEWQEYVATVVSRYGDSVSHWGMWNEPNLGFFYRGSESDYINEILIPGAQAARAAHPDAVVAGPDLAGLRGSDRWNGDNGTCLFGSCIYNGWEVSLSNILDAAGHELDVITHHFYTDDAADLAGRLLDGRFEVVQVSSSLKEVVETHGQGQPVWLTEWGWETEAYGGYGGGGGVSDAAQARHMTEFWEIFPQIQDGSYPESTNDPWPQLQRLFIYNDRDWVDAGLNEVWSFGIRYVDGSPKPAYTALQDHFAANAPRCDDTGSAAPVWSPLPDLTLDQGKPRPHARDLLAYAQDADTPSNGLVFSVQRCTPAEVTCGIRDGHFVELAPQDYWTGSGEVEVRVSDGHREAVTTTGFTVEPAPPAPHYSAPYRDHIELDGLTSDWSGIEAVNLLPPSDWAGVRGDTPTSDDIAASFQIAWADGTLYLAVEVEDDTHQHFPLPETMWMGDSVQIAIDGGHNGALGYDADDWEFGAMLNGARANTHCWQTPTEGDCPVTADATRDGTTTRYELRLRADLPSSTVGLTVLVNDDDGEGREGWLEWTPGVGLGKAPGMFGTVDLEESGAGPFPDAGVTDTGLPSADTGVDDTGGSMDTGHSEDPLTEADAGAVSDVGGDTGVAPPEDSPRSTPTTAGSSGCAVAGPHAHLHPWILAFAAVVVLRRRRAR